MAWLAKIKEGPSAMIVVWSSNPMQMGKQLTQWAVYCLVISALIAHVAVSALHAGDGFARVFYLTGLVGILAYAGNAAIGAIWFGHSWSRTVKDIIDGMIYGVATGLVFAWLWPA